MRSLLVALIVLFATPALADYTFVIPQKPGGGTSVWAQIVATELEKKLGEKIVLKHIPGARDIPGFNKFHNELRADDKTVMVSHGGNAVAFLQEKVDYNYAEYDSIGLMNLNIITAKRTGTTTPIRFAAGSGMVPEAFAMTIDLCRDGSEFADFATCFKNNVVWVKGMSGGERRLAFRRGELNGTRENPAAFKKHVNPSIDKGEAFVWFDHGILDAKTGQHTPDPNYPNTFVERDWTDHMKSTDMYAAYKLVKSFRDGMQKALWVRKGNPNTDKLRNALTEMTNDPKSIAAIQKKVGQYEWVIGEAGNSHRDTIMQFITEPALRTLVRFNKDVLGLSSVFKSDLVN